MKVWIQKYNVSGWEDPVNVIGRVDCTKDYVEIRMGAIRYEAWHEWLRVNVGYAIVART
jgi:hypothetical protein